MFDPETAMLASLCVVMSASPMPSPVGSFTLTLGPSGARGTGPGESVLLAGDPADVTGLSPAMNRIARWAGPDIHRTNGECAILESAQLTPSELRAGEPCAGRTISETRPSASIAARTRGKRRLCIRPPLTSPTHRGA